MLESLAPAGGLSIVMSIALTPHILSDSLIKRATSIDRYNKERFCHEMSQLTIVDRNDDGPTHLSLKAPLELHQIVQTKGVTFEIAFPIGTPRAPPS